MKLDETRFFVALKMLSGAQKRNLIILLIVPACIFFFWDDIVNSVMNYAAQRKAPVAVDNVRMRVEINAETYDMLEKAILNYKPVNILAGIQSGNLTKYFIRQPKKETPAPAVTTPPSSTVRETAGLVPKAPPVRYANDLTFIYLGNNKDYVIIDNKLLRQGDKTLSGLTVEKIEQSRVLLKGKWSSQWITLKF